MEMPVEVASAIRLESAYFCLSCEVVTNCSDVCPACGHRQLWHLEHWLGRVHGQENSADEESTLREVKLARTGEIAKTASGRIHLEVVRNCSG